MGLKGRHKHFLYGDRDGSRSQVLLLGVLLVAVGALERGLDYL